MRKLFKVFAVALAIGLFGVLTSSSVPVNESGTTNEEACSNEEGIGCKVYHPKSGKVINKCFICNCGRLVEKSVLLIEALENDRAEQPEIIAEQDISSLGEDLSY
ncbi:MAG: hypothetical protein GDA51_12360 [Ekhidna sp.]|nr:hypothetical protein [Ekhidna sp.]MBC6427226.1 hypothetical protein [Ekhidna sp.]